MAATYFPIGSYNYSIQTFVLAAFVAGQGIPKSFTIMEKRPETLRNNWLLLATLNGDYCNSNLWWYVMTKHTFVLRKPWTKEEKKSLTYRFVFQARQSYPIKGNSTDNP